MRRVRGGVGGGGEVVKDAERKEDEEDAHGVTWQ